MELNELSVNQLMDIAFAWARTNDIRLYENMDDIFKAFECRRGDFPTGWQDYKTNLINVPSFFIGDIFEAAIAKSDYHDCYKFRWTFDGSGNRDHSYAYKYNTEHPYLYVKSWISMRLTELKQLGLDSWRKSADPKKHTWFRTRLNGLITEANTKTLFLKVLGTEYDIVRIDLDLSSSYYDKTNFKSIVQYVIDKHITPKEFAGITDLNILDTIPNTNGNNCYKVIRDSGKNIPLFHLTAAELLDCYKHYIKRHSLTNSHKAAWAYVNSMAKNRPDFKFYFYFYAY